ncbi:unnamed protein product [Heligmosomoides polygyrus]|uniref:C2H2-type domain-containing protein n=1 Tax=Heligmosomoides polygyrus TaxID=6339 RepID=A0A3P8BXW7_HELPZ|nr:unnamed protein product [Heligmosomoides polygyrus]
MSVSSKTSQTSHTHSSNAESEPVQIVLERRQENKENLPADQCPECENVLARYRLYEHLFKKHNWSKDRIEALKNQRKAALSADNEFACECGLKFKAASSLSRHRKDKGHRRPDDGILLCPGCGMRMKNHWALVYHVGECHSEDSDDYKIEEATFQDMDSFEKWKNELGIESITQFTTNTTCTYRSGTVTYMREIGIKHKIDPSRRDDDDIASVEKRVSERNAKDGIKIYYPPVEDKGDGFVIVIITPIQEEWLRKYSRRAVCIDDTFNLTQYTLRLATVVVPDEWDRGLPAAYLLSRRMTEKEIAILFGEIKKVVADFNPKYFMSDDTNSFFNGFIQVFHNSNVGEYMSKVIADMKELNEDTVGVIQRHHKHTLDQMARRSDLPATGRLPNHAAIRLKKRSTSKRSGKSREEPESQLLERYNVDDLQCCILCYRRIPETDAGREFDEWVKCSACGMWAHEACARDGTACSYDEGCFQFSQMPN